MCNPFTKSGPARFVAFKRLAGLLPLAATFELRRESFNLYAKALQERTMVYCAGPPILAPAFVEPKHVVVIDVIVVFSEIDREDLETTCLAVNHHESLFRSIGPSMLAPPCFMSSPPPSTQRSGLCAKRASKPSIKTFAQVPRRTELKQFGFEADYIVPDRFDQTHAIESLK